MGAGSRRGRPGIAVVWIHVAGSRRGRLDPPPCGSPVPARHAAPRLREREMREVLRGERGWEREGERDTGHGGALLARSGHGPRPAWWRARRRGGGARDLARCCAAEKPSHAGGARDGEVVARATSIVPTPRRGLHTPAREREREWERERERGSRRGLHAGDGGSACVAVLVAGREVGAAPGDER